MSFIDFATIENKLKQFAGEVNIEHSVTIKGGLYDGHRALTFRRRVDNSLLMYVIDGPMFPFPFEDAPISMILSGDIDNAIKTVKNMIDVDIISCVPFMVGFEHGMISTHVHIFIGIQVITQDWKYIYRYVIEPGGISISSAEGI